MTTEVTYQLSGAWGQFFDDVQTYCRELAESVEQTGSGSARLIWYATLALLRCVASSPAAAVKALNTRLTGALENDTCLSDDRLYDGQADDLAGSDLEPPAQLQDVGRLQDLIAQAESLSGKSGDPKLVVLIEHIKHLLAEGYSPVIFCRYIATAHYVAQHLRKQFPSINIEAVTGEYTPEEREQRVQAMDETAQRLLVATDC
jgi:hypothetical protein